MEIGMSLCLSNATMFDFPFSSASYRLRIALNLKGREVNETELVDIRAGGQNHPGYLDKTAAALVPAIDFGSETHGQSIALIEWLDATYPEPRLIPADPRDALIVREMAFVVVCDIHPLNNPRVLKQLTGNLGVSEDSKNAWYAKWVRAGFDTLEYLAGRHADAGRFCFGGEPTLADVCLVPQMANALRFDVPVDEFVRLHDICRACNQLPAFSEAGPKF